MLVVFSFFVQASAEETLADKRDRDDFFTMLKEMIEKELVGLSYVFSPVNLKTVFKIRHYYLKSIYFF